MSCGWKISRKQNKVRSVCGRGREENVSSFPAPLYKMTKVYRMNRLNYILKRVLQIIPVLIIVSILIFLMLRFIPGDPARLVLGDKATEAEVAAMHKKLGLDQSMLTQYWIYIKGIFTLNLGDSLKYQRPIVDLLKERVGVTLLLTLVSTVFSLVVSFPLGYFAGMHKDKVGDHVIRTAALAAIAMPSFWVGLLLMIVFGLWFHVLPVGGWGSTFTDQLRCLILPGITQSLMTSALLIRNIRNSVVEVNVLDYVDFARSKGISEKKVKNNHILRNAMISTVTLLSMRIAYMLGGSVIIETVFSLPGIGALTTDAIFSRDYSLVQTLVFLFAFLVLVINLLTDILYSFLDPRVEL